MEKVFYHLIVAIEAPQKSSRRAAALAEAKKLLVEMENQTDFDQEKLITEGGE